MKIFRKMAIMHGQQTIRLSKNRHIPSKRAGSNSHLVQISWEAWPEVGWMILAHWLASGLDPFGPNLTQSARAKLDMPAYTIRSSSGCMLAVMAITGRNQNASGSDLACLLGLLCMLHCPFLENSQLSSKKSRCIGAVVLSRIVSCFHLANYT